MAGDQPAEASEHSAELSHGVSRRGAEEGGDQAAVCCHSSGFPRQLLPAGGGQRIELGPAVVLRPAPLGRDEALLLQLEQRGVEGAVVEGEPVPAGLLDPAGDSVAVERPEDLEGPEDHQGQGALLDIQFFGHGSCPMGFPYDSSAPAPPGREGAPLYPWA